MNNNFAYGASGKNIVSARIKAQRSGNDRICIGGRDAINADSEKTVAGIIRFTRADENRRRIGRRNSHRADCQRKRVIHQRSPGLSAVQSAVKSALCRADISNIGVTRVNGNRNRPPGNRK